MKPMMSGYGKMPMHAPEKAKPGKKLPVPKTPRGFMGAARER